MEQKKLLVGRKPEIERLQMICTSPKSEFLALYGRRRVGKTFLIREFFNNRFSFDLTGLANVDISQNLFNFHSKFERNSHFTYEKQPVHWLEAFQRLIIYLERLQTAEKKIIFFDEMPWLDTKGSDFLTGLEHFWNSWAANRKDIVLIATGSAASWIINELINSPGGLHNRITHYLEIRPFTLSEVEAFVTNKNISLNRYQIVQLYMALGGIPHYWDAVQPGLSAAQNIQYLFFDKNAPLKNEFANLYRALFKKHEVYEKLVAALYTKTMGLQRTELSKYPGLSSGGTLTKVLSDLERSGFITAYNDLHNKQKNTLYRLSDYYTAFYFRFIQSGQYRGEQAWLNLLDNPSHRAWQGFAFEQICIDHIVQIKKALGISGILSSHVAWNGGTDLKKAQIDLLIDRRDEVINICEAKFSINPYTINKDYANKLREKIGVFKAATNTKKSVFLTFITTYGVAKNEHALQLVQNEVTMDDLFDSKPTGIAQVPATAITGEQMTLADDSYNIQWSLWQKVLYVLRAAGSPMSSRAIYEAIGGFEGIEEGSTDARRLMLKINATLSMKMRGDNLSEFPIERFKQGKEFLYVIKKDNNGINSFL